MLNRDFREQRARTVRELAERAADPFIKARLKNLAARYDDDRAETSTTLTPIDLLFGGLRTGARLMQLLGVGRL